MIKEHKILLGGLIAVALLDTFGSIASRQLDFNYSNLFFLSFLIYGTTCFLVTQIAALNTGVMHGMILGLFDSTIGFKISILLDANTGNTNYELTTGLWIIIVVLMIGYGAFVGLISGGLASLLKRRDINAQSRRL
jgi:hypothetical protein